jgi:catechol 2,3-dioxygenase-like lactoylglutathione lyase family enzyme
VPELLALQIADAPKVWRDLGFSVVDGACPVDGVRHQLGVVGHGVVAWTLGGADDLEELPTAAIDEVPMASAPVHPNGVTTLDHVVVVTPDLARTIAALESTGLSLRRRRDAGTEDRPMTQAFFKLGSVVLEVVGSPTAAGTGPASFWGLTYTVADLDATVSFLGARLRPVKAAVQEGRRIAVLDRAAGSSVPIAFMSARA